MENKPIVSVIIPTYKSTTTLGEAIESALNQTYNNIEVIVIDDNNPNTKHRKATEKMMMDYNEEPNVTYIKHEKNKNGSAARNTGFKRSSGEYICFLDDDDVFLPTKVEKQVSYLKQNDQFHAVYSWRIQNGKVFKCEKTGDLSEELLSLSFTPYTSSIMLKSSCYKALKGFDEGFKRHQDFEFLLRFFEKYSIGVINEPLIEVRGNQIDNALHGRDLVQLKEQFLSKFNHHINRINYEKKGFKKLVYSRHYSKVFWDCLARGKLGIVLPIFLKNSIKYRFVFWKAIIKDFIIKAKVKLTSNN